MEESEVFGHAAVLGHSTKSWHLLCQVIDDRLIHTSISRAVCWISLNEAVCLLILSRSKIASASPSQLHARWSLFCSSSLIKAAKFLGVGHRGVVIKQLLYTLSRLLLLCARIVCQRAHFTQQYFATNSLSRNCMALTLPNRHCWLLSKFLFIFRRLLIMDVFEEQWRPYSQTGTKAQVLCQ